MGDLIRREAILKILNAKANMAAGTDAQMVYDHVAHMIGKMPAVDAEPVLHGRWEMTFGSYSTPHCTKCGWHIPYSEDSVLEELNYCPNCGALMDAKEEDHGKES